MSEPVPLAPRASPTWRWSFLIVVAAGILATVTVNLGRLPTGARGYYARGLVDMRAGRYGAAIENLDRAVALDPDWCDARLARANVWLHEGHPYRALVDADAAALLRDGAAKGHYVRGLALRQLGRYDEAFASLNDAVRSDPSLGKALLARANLLNDVGQLDDALAEYRRVASFRRKDETFYFAPVLIWEARTLGGDTDGAVAELRERVQASLADRGRLAPWVLAATGGASQVSSVATWVEGVRQLARGKRNAAIASLRSAAAASPADSWERERAWAMLQTLTLGLRVQPDNDEISTSFSFGPGIAIGWVCDRGAAALAGLSVGDRLVRVGEADASRDRMEAIVGHAPPGSELPVTVYRDGSLRSATIVVGAGTVLTPGSSAPTR